MTGQEVRSVEDAVSIWAAPETDDDSFTEKLTHYRLEVLRKLGFIVICIIASFLVILYALQLNYNNTDMWQAWQVVIDHLTNNIKNTTDDWIIFNVHLPRIVRGIIAGAGLAAAGAVMQSILRNPLADPYTTGISSGASFGATLAVGLGITVAGESWGIVGNAFIFALIPMAVILLLSKFKGASPTLMVMAGIAVMYIFNAVNTMIKLWLSPDQQSYLFSWSVGSIEGANWDGLDIMAAVVFVSVFVLLLISKRLNVVATGDESARSIGVNPEHMRIVSLLIVSLMTAAVVSFTGLIGFVGLVCPHIARIFVGSDNRFLVPASAVCGIAMITIADTIGRTLLYPNVLQVGVITAFVGGPLFLYLIIRQKRLD